MVVVMWLLVAGGTSAVDEQLAWYCGNEWWW